MKQRLIFKYIIISALFVLVLLIMLLFSKRNIENYDYYEKYKNVKTVCIVWHNKIDKGIEYFGFGDNLRGAIYIYRFFKNINPDIDIMVDGTHDICGDILQNVTTPYSDQIKTVNINYLLNCGEEKMENLIIEKDNTIFIYTNLSIDSNQKLSNDEKEFAKFICEPKDNIKTEINEKIKKLPNDFTVKHVRFDDEIFKKDIDIGEPIFQKMFEKLKQDYLPTDILITNSNNFTKYANDKLNIQYIDCNNEICNVGHIGQSNNYEIIKNSYIEFCIIGKSKQIKSYTVHSWPSNFVYWTSLIYDIPFNSIENL